MESVKEEAIPQDGEEVTSTKRKSAIDQIEVDLTLPEPPSKRARRALKKGKPLPAKNDSSDEKAKADGDGEQSDKKEKARSEHGIWVGNLPFTITAAELRQWLVDNSGGVITDDSITRIKIPTSKDPGRDKSQKPANKGFAYVDFTDIAGKVAAIAISETELGHRKLLIKDSKSFEGRPAKEKEPEAVETGPDGKVKHGAEQNKEADPNASRKIFVGNMSFKTTEEDVWRNFEKCGEIDWVKVATFEDTGKCKGYGWVKFKQPEAAAWAVKGFVKVKEAVETEDDFNDGDDAEDRKQDQQKQFKTRKWWVNRMLGRELKLELAEDDQSRYKKRFGKDAQRQANGGERKGRPSQGRNGFKSRDEAASDNSGAKTEAPEKAAKPLKEAADIQVARLTGAVVKHTGTKMTFD
ncbi:Nucleotide-binding, alpha-beta plait [Metarhizium brunneum]